MNLSKYLLAILFLHLTTPMAAAEEPTNHYDVLVEKLNNSSRAERDKQRDSNRKPVDIMKFSGITPGMKVLEIIAAGGYYTEVLSYQVGPKGEVLSHNNNFMLTVQNGIIKNEIDNRLANHRLKNVTPFIKEFGQFDLDSEVDAATLILNYHDIYKYPLKRRIAILHEIKKALKPGGIFLVIDSEANKKAYNPKLHRLNSDVAKKEIIGAGFKLIKESTILENKKDDHSLAVFDSTIRGKTDRYVLKFVK